MNAVSVLIDLAILGFVGWVTYDAVTRWRAATGTWREKLLAVGRGSGTIVVQRAAYLIAGAAELLPVVADTLGAPSVATAIQTVMPAGTGPYYMLALALISEWARHRTLPPLSP